MNHSEMLKVRVEGAILALEKAHSQLTRALKSAKAVKDWEAVGSIADYKDKVAELLSSDDGEAGMKRFFKVLK